MSEPVDLGALQKAMRAAEAAATSANRTYDSAYTKYESAIRALEFAKKKRADAMTKCDLARTAVIEGARQVASTR